MARRERPILASGALNAAVVALCLMSIFLLYRLLRQPENSYTPVNARSSAFSPADDHPEREAKPEAPRGVSSLDMVERVVVPFAEPQDEAPPESGPEPAPPPQPPAEAPAADPAPEEAPPALGRPNLRKVAIPERNAGSAASTSAFLPAAPDEKKKRAASSAGPSPAAKPPPKTRDWRTPTGHSSSHP